MRNKYNNRKVTVDGNKFDSLGESRRYLDLKLLVNTKKISRLELQKVFVLQDSFISDGKKISKITYKPDFVYYDEVKKRIVAEDFKGFETAVFKIKEKLFRLKYPEYYFLITKAK